MAHLNKKIIWERPDGGISITHLDDRDKLPGESDDDFIARYALKLNISPNKTVVDSSDIPTDKSQRNEWSLKNKKVEVDQAKVVAKQAKEAEINAIYSKIGLTKEEFEKIRGNKS